MTTVFTGDIGTEIKLDCKSDVSSATVKSIVARKPNGSKVTWSATLEGTDFIKYVILSGDLDVAGTWHLQAKVDMPGWSGSGEVAVLRVERPL